MSPSRRVNDRLGLYVIDALEFDHLIRDLAEAEAVGVQNKERTCLRVLQLSELGLKLG